MKLKRIFLIAFALVFAINLTACGKNSDQNRDNTINIGTLKGPTMMGMAKLDKDNKDGLTENKYTFMMEPTLDPITAALSKNELDAVVIPVNTAAILHNNSNIGINIAAVSVLGVLSVVTTNPDIVSIEDLKGKTIIMTGANTVTQYSFEHLLKEHGINPDTGLNIEYFAETAEALARLISGASDTAVLPQPFVTSAVRQAAAAGITLRVAMKINDEWAKIDSLKDTPPVTAVLVVRSNYLKYNKAVFDKFLDEYKSSVDYMTAAANIDAAAALVAGLEIIPNAVIAKAALPECSLTFTEGDAMQTTLEAFYSVLFAGNSASVGGKLPGEDFYYKR